MAPAPDRYTIRIVDATNQAHDTPVGADGRVRFDVPVYSRHCTQYLFGLFKVHSPKPVEKRRVIHVMHNGKPVRKLSAEDIARLPVESGGCHPLIIAVWQPGISIP